MKNILFFLSCYLFPALAFCDWHIQRADFEAKELFKATQTYELYTGDSAVEEREKKPQEGFKFILVQIQAKNDGNSQDLFKSKEILLKSGNNTYPRLKEDKFLLEYNIKPFTQLTLKKGSHQGTLIFEVPQDMDLTDLKLIYHSKEIQQ